MTILLEPAIEAQLRGRAAREKQDADATANALLTSGLIMHIPLPRDPNKAERSWIVIQGEPISGAILRERR